LDVAVHTSLHSRLNMFPVFVLFIGQPSGRRINVFSGTECCAGELDEMLFGQLANSRVESGLSWLHWPLVAGRICGMHSRITRVEALPTHAQPLAGFHFVALRNRWLSQSASKLGIGMGIAFGFCISLYARIYLSGGSTSRTDANETS